MHQYMSKLPKKITILTISNLLFEANLHRKIMTLKNAEYQIHLFAVFHPKVDLSQWLGINLTRIRLISGPTALRFLQFVFKALIWVLHQKSDLYISYDYLPLFPLQIKKILRRDKYIYDSIELVVGMNQLEGRPLRKWIWRVYESFGIRGAADIFAVCGSDAEHLQKVYPRIQIPKVIRNIPLYNVTESGGNPLREKYKISKNIKIGIYQGMVFKGRGLHNLIRAAVLYRDLVLFIVGDGPLLPELKILADQSDIADRIIFTGGVPFEKLSEYTAGADIGFTIISGKGLSYYHALPNKLFEYIQAGIPVIGSDYPEIKKVIEEDDIGVTVSPHSVEAITNAIGNMMIPENYERFKKNIIQIREKYTWQKESDLYLQVIRKILDDSV